MILGRRTTLMYILSLIPAAPSLALHRYHPELVGVGFWKNSEQRLLEPGVEMFPSRTALKCELKS